MSLDKIKIPLNRVNGLPPTPSFDPFVFSPGIVFSPDNKYIILQSSSLVYFYSIEEEKVVKILDTGVLWGKIVFSPNGKYIAVQERCHPNNDTPDCCGIAIWDLQKCSLIKTLKPKYSLSLPL